MILFINTSKDSELDVFLIKENRILDKLVLKGDYRISENLLKLVTKLLKKNKVNFRQLKGILTVSGPGPFTSIRISTAIVNTLSYTLQIPISGIVMKRKKLTNQQLINLGLKQLHKAKAMNYIQPYYDKEPNITRQRV